MKILGWIFFMAAFVVSCSDDPAKQDPAETGAAVTEASLKEWIAKYPDSALLKEKLVQYYRDNFNDSAAITTVNGILKDDPVNHRWWHIKAQLHAENDDTLNAIKSWEKAAAIYPDPKYLLPLGYLYADLNDPKAIIVADTLINAYKPKYDKEALLVKGIYYGKTDKQKAIGYFDKALALSYTFMEAYREKAIVLYKLGNYAEAVKVLERALSIQHSYDEAYYWLGRCYERLNKPNEAKENYQLAIRAASENKEDYPEAVLALDSLQIKSKSKGGD